MKNILLFLSLLVIAQKITAQVSHPPQMVDNTPQGTSYISVNSENASNGTTIAMDSHFYVKNIGGAGNINVMIIVSYWMGYWYSKDTEYVQIAVDSNVAYELTSRFPVSRVDNPQLLNGYGLNVSASFSGTPGLALNYSGISINYYETAKSSSVLGLLTDVEGKQLQSPFSFSLKQNYPNPFNPSTIISFTLPSRSFAILTIFDLLGKEVATIVSEELSAGNYSRQWNAGNLPSGVYFYRLQAGSFSQIKKLILLK